MKRTKWIMGLSLTGVLLLTGGAMALASGNTAFQSIGQAMGIKSVPAATQVQSSNIKTLANSTALTTPQNTGNSTPATNPKTSEATNASLTVPNTNVNQNPYGGYGMMGGGYGPNGSGGYGMMGGGYGLNGNGGYGMMGGGYGTNGNGGYGMMGGGYDAASLGVTLQNGQITSSDQADAIAKAYTQKLNSGLAVDELHEFADSFEVELINAQTKAKAYEVMISKNGGRIYTEMGPNIMWNTQFGHMSSGQSGTLTVTSDQATQNANASIAKIGQGYTIEKPETAPGYYEFMIQKDGKDFAELDVNGYSGQVWFENWHGPIIKSIEANK